MKTYQFKIQIKGIQKPPVWRKVFVPSDITFDTFHQIIQAAFGWDNYHLYHFSKYAWTSEVVYKIPYDSDYDDFHTKDSQLSLISEVFTVPKQSFIYMYDFGDNWEHQIVLEAISDEKIFVPMCIDGKGACPPEDCGGIPGYQNLVEIMHGPKNPEYKEMINWLGLKKNAVWDVNAFDKEAANERCSQIIL